MDAWARNETECDGNEAVRPGEKDIYVQLVISFSLGLSAFVLFCFLRPRWPTLYAARKRHSDPQVNLPTLPDSFLGWIPALYRVTEAQVLASAGLDAYVFLSFFKMAMRLFVIMFFFAATVLWPINNAFVEPPAPSKGGSNGHKHDLFPYRDFYPKPLSRAYPLDVYDLKHADHHNDDGWLHMNKPYLWSYLAFTWFFALLTMYYLNKETYKIIKVRQDYLGTQSTITDRTFRLTGIPKDLRSEAKIKEFVENLEIGRVKSVTLCRDWAEVDGLMAERNAVLRKLEEAWSVYMNKKPTIGVARSRYNGEDSGLGTYSDEHEAHENNSLLAGDSLRNLAPGRPRPTTRIRFGFFKFRSRQTDAIDYYEEQLHRLDEKVHAARRKQYTPAATAFVTMDSIAACQMAIQAVIDPRPGQFLSKPAPAPSDVVWKNTYAPMWRRRLQAWTVTIFITVLSIIWIIPVASVAGFVSVCTIRKLSPSLEEFLLRHEITKALVQTALPVGVVSLLNVLVPYLYDYLANQQGMVSQGDVELSVVSKNFFFTFFNVFLVFTVGGSTSQIWPVLRESFNDTQYIAVTLARSITRLSNFYLNFIMLQGIGLFPFRLLQFGSVSLYPIYRWGAKTPRDFAEIVQPTLFNYGFYLPTSLLVFILCLVYSVLPNCQLVLLLGLCYFTLGYYAHKYQLLYSMDQPQHATGGAWRIISYRLIFGLCIFEVVMGGILLLQGALYGAALVAPLLILTVWFAYYFSQRYTPLTLFISLRSIKRDVDPSAEGNPGRDQAQQPSQMRLTRRMSTVDEDKEKGMLFVNPNLVAPLEQPWIYKDPPPPLSVTESMQVPYSDDPDNQEESGDTTPSVPSGENGAGLPGPPRTSATKLYIRGKK
ncbi:hypothetical protein BKA67DRAFT_641587 [Truncatella angustata]|uniref:DUF221-domain-containing protein n=1 Tax=Truncatella angustata TaxID=152316 RepID=A0A9P8UXT0_9PEZI|nr:uncharacterized protein BKA67DRAFT_641587 [Truncatella angustata]KAH6660506.1 hypothetical protein BKA67DRAFT_641587 [Truncatella angustata]